jgi:hypothetical protein
MPKTSPKIVKSRLSRANPKAGRTPPAIYIVDRRMPFIKRWFMVFPMEWQAVT